MAKSVLFRYKPMEPEMTLQLFGARFRLSATSTTPKCGSRPNVACARVGFIHIGRHRPAIQTPLRSRRNHKSRKRCSGAKVCSKFARAVTRRKQQSKPCRRQRPCRIYSPYSRGRLEGPALPWEIAEAARLLSTAPSAQCSGSCPVRLLAALFLTEGDCRATLAGALPTRPALATRHGRRWRQASPAPTTRCHRRSSHS